MSDWVLPVCTRFVLQSRFKAIVEHYSIVDSHIGL